MAVVEGNLIFSLMFEYSLCSSFTFQQPLCDENFRLMDKQNNTCSLSNAFIKLLRYIKRENDGSL